MKIFGKTLLSVILAVVLIAGIGALGFGGYVVYARSCKIKLTADESSVRQTIDGFGSSACWWAQAAGRSENLDFAVRYLYSDEGLGLNIYRYNIGGGSADDVNCRFYDHNWRTTESFLYYDKESGTYKYDFSRDANAQKTLEAALAYGNIDTVILFANSPHFSMTANGMTECGQGDGNSNLPEENYQAYAEYFLDITAYFLNKGVPVKYISPINEPQWGWGGTDDEVRQEGCHYSPEEAAKLLGVFAREIEKRAMNVKLSGLESGNIGDTAKKYYTLMTQDEVLMRNLGTYSYHSYFSDDNTLQKQQFGSWLSKNIADGVATEMSEWCELPCERKTDDFASALLMARVISNDITLSGVNSWSAWVGVNDRGTADGEEGYYSDGILNASADFSEISVSERYYGYAHFTKYIPVGSVAIDLKKNVSDFNFEKFNIKNTATWKNTYVNASAFTTPDGDTVLVLVNEGKARTIQAQLTAQNMEIVQSCDEKRLETIYSGAVKNEFTLPANSITTILYKK